AAIDLATRPGPSLFQPHTLVDVVFLAIRRDMLWAWVATRAAVHPDGFFDTQLLLTGPADSCRRHVVLVSGDRCRPPLCHTQLFMQRLLQAADIAAGSDGSHDELFDVSQMLLGDAPDQRDILGNRRVQGFLDGRRDLKSDGYPSFPQT